MIIKKQTVIKTGFRILCGKSANQSINSVAFLTRFGKIRQQTIERPADAGLQQHRRVRPRDLGLRRLDPQAAEIGRRYLRHWDGRVTPDSASAAFFALFRLRFAMALLGDELGPELVDLLRIGAVAYNPLQEAMFSGRSSFWDDVGTSAVEGPAHIWARALRATQAEVVRRVGDPERLRLDRIKRLTFPHSFHWMRLVGRFFDVGPIAQGGDDHTVSVLKAPLGEPDLVQFVPSYRVVFTPGDWGTTRGTNTLGQSGHRFSPFRADQLQDWSSGEGHPWRWGGPPPDEVIGVLHLSPL